MIGMGKSTKVRVFALSRFVGVTRTEFSFVLIWVVKLFCSIMSKRAWVCLGALFFLHNKLAHNAPVRPKLTSPVFSLIMEEGTPLLFMIAHLLTSRSLKDVQVKKHDTTFFRGLNLFLMLFSLTTITFLWAWCLFFRAWRLFQLSIKLCTFLLSSHAWPSSSWSFRNCANLNIWMFIEGQSRWLGWYRLWFFLFELLSGKFFRDKLEITSFFILLVFMVVWAFRGLAVCAQELANSRFVSKRMVENFMLGMCELTSAAKTAWTYLNARLSGIMDP